MKPSELPADRRQAVHALFRRMQPDLPGGREYRLEFRASDRLGANAFAHEAGIHQHGVMMEKSTYEIMDPRSVGVPESKLVLGKHSGRHALGKRCADLGFPLNREELDLVYQRFTALADRKKGVRNEEIAGLVRETVARAAAQTAGN